MNNYLSELIRVAKYSRYLPEEGRRETWAEQVDRMIAMHKTHISGLGGDGVAYVDKQLDNVRSVLLQKKIVGSQRALQYGGDGILNKHARIYNCCGSFADRARVIQETMWLLLCGCGVGMNIAHAHIDKLPKFYPLDTTKPPFKHTIPDSIEGWADALGVLLASYIRDETVRQTLRPIIRYETINKKRIRIYGELPPSGVPIEFDYSEIRPARALIRSSGALAPGPQPLHKSLLKIRKLIDKMLADAGSAVNGVAATQCLSGDGVSPPALLIYDIMLHSAAAVISGGIRRSALLFLCDHDDNALLNAKTGNWYATNPQREYANNSIILDRETTTLDEFEKLMMQPSVRQFGEPGIMWASSDDVLYNPCGEVALYPRGAAPPLDPQLSDGCIRMLTDDNQQGCGEARPPAWGFCNLCEINVKTVVDKEDFLKCCEAAAILGTIQATYTTFDYLGDYAEQVARQDPLLGVSLTGIMDNPIIGLDADILEAGAKLIVKTNKFYAKLLGINPASRCTCVKPSGTTSLLLDTSSGVHLQFAREYLRRVRIASTDPLGKFLLQHMPTFCEVTGPPTSDPSESSQYVRVEDDATREQATALLAKPGSQLVISIPCKSPANAICDQDISSVEFLKRIIFVEQHWVAMGTDPDLLPQPWLRHNVSNTINPTADAEWKPLIRLLYESRDVHTGSTIFSATGDKNYFLAPKYRIHRLPELQTIYGEAPLLTGSGLIVHLLKQFNNIHDACEMALNIFVRGSAAPFPTLTDITSNKMRASTAEKLTSRLVCISRIKKFATDHFDGDVLRATYCLKDIDALKRWFDLIHIMPIVPWDTAPVESKRPDIAAGCSSGACEVTIL